MIRFLIVLVCISAMALALCGIASRFTITLTIVPINGSHAAEPAREPAPAAVTPSKPAPKAKVGASVVDSHHTKGT